MTQFLSKILVALAIAISLTACGGTSDEPAVPFTTAAEVQAAFAQAPRLLNNYFHQTDEERGMVTMEYLHADDLRDSWHLVIRYKGQKIYDRTLWAIYQQHGVTTQGDDVIIVSEYEAPVPGSGTVVFVNGERIPALQSLPATIAGRQFPAWTRNIVEYRDGWLLVFGSSFGRGGWHVDRYALYHPRSGQFYDCGEYGPLRFPEYGPSGPSTCVRR